MGLGLGLRLGSGSSNAGIGVLTVDGGDITDGGTDAQGDKNWRLPYTLAYELGNAGTAI